MGSKVKQAAVQKALKQFLNVAINWLREHLKDNIKWGKIQKGKSCTLHCLLDK